MRKSFPPEGGAPAGEPYHVTFLASTLGTGGAERMIREFALRLDGHKYAPSVVCLNARGEVGKEISSHGIPVVDGIMGSRSDPFVLLKLRRALKNLATDLLFCLEHRDAVVLGTLASLGLVRRTFVAVHSTRLWGGQKSLGLTTRWCLRFVERVLAVGENQAAYLAQEEGVARNKIAVIPNGIELSEFEKMPSPAEVRGLIGLKPDSLVVGIVAALRPEKNHELFLEAASVVAREMEEVHFVIVGGGKRRALLEGLAAGLGITSNVHFVGERNDGRLLIQAFDVALLCSHPVVETLPIFLMEAMALGKPVISTRVGDVPSLVEAGTTGLLVPPGSREELSGAMLRLLRDERLRVEMGRRGREKVAREFSLDRSVRMLERLIEMN
ncbi:MAG: glycosyltransferase [Candidatus Eisenbacteria bacterium]|nr:glycosyltransferase [Candidatus Eisenbacteria bacterium]